MLSRYTRWCLRSNWTTGSDALANGAPGPVVEAWETATTSPGAGPRCRQVLPPSNDVAQPVSTAPPLAYRPIWNTPTTLPGLVGFTATSGSTSVSSSHFGSDLGHRR